ncbi:hypothetical protein JCM11641_007143 [Rhodosporidiobolus odoratus]
MHRFTPLALPSLQSLSALLYPDELVQLQQHNVGLYNGKDKAPLHQHGALVLTTHRLLFLHSTHPHKHSLALPLDLIRQSEFWTGFLKSSPKITLTLNEPRRGDLGEQSDTLREGDTEEQPRRDDPERLHRQLAHQAQGRSWVCRVCGMGNPPSAKCSLCGVPNDTPSTSSSSAPPSTAPSRFSTPPPPVPPVPPRPAPSSASPASTIDAREAGARLSCPVCTFLNHHSMTSCEVCGSALFPSSSIPTSRRPAASSASNSTSTSTSATSTPRPATPASSGNGNGSDKLPTFVRLSFRQGGAGPFYAKLKEQLGERRWEIQSSRGPKGGSKDARSQNSATGEGHEGKEGVGIDAILRNLTLTSQNREDEMDVALRDLESLMSKAGEMIALAQSINAQLSTSSSTSTSSSSTPTPEAAALATRSLTQLGLLTQPAVTSSTSSTSTSTSSAASSNTSGYHLDLAKELVGVLEKSRLVERGGGVVGLDEVWCSWNRARGVALVSPKDLRLTAPYLPTLTRNPKLNLLTFPKSGLTILHDEKFSRDAFGARLGGWLDEESSRGGVIVDDDDDDEQVVEEGGGGGDQTPSPRNRSRDGNRQRPPRQPVGGLNLLQIAQQEHISLGLAKELVELIEMEPTRGGLGEEGSIVCRDEQQVGEGVRWFRNVISMIGAEGEADGGGWDGQVF